MSRTTLKAVTIYLSSAEYKQIAEDADEHGVTVSAYVRARLGFEVTQRGAPAGNQNRKKQSLAAATSKEHKGVVKKRRE